ncbi:MAG: NADPH-dependent assimilatory sulfite reductase hemoprotein subunit [Acidobacteriota bacterium]
MSKTSLEDIKTSSHGLRGRIAEDLGDGSDRVGADSAQLLKFHGIYQQDDRDQRADRRRDGRDKAWSFMLRSRLPGGRLTPDAWLAHDRIADAHGGGRLRITSRQGLQLHGVLKDDLRPALAELDRALVSSLGACGDVVRNVTCCPLPASSRLRDELDEVTDALADRFALRTRAHRAIWLDGEKQDEVSPGDDDTYGAAYLPRKFKLGIAPPDDNCIDAWTQDLGLLATTRGGRVDGFDVLVGGGLGAKHGKDHAVPRLGLPLGWVSREEVVDLVAAVVSFHRDHGDRDDRSRARLKFLVHGLGLDVVRQEVRRRFAGRLHPSHGAAPRPRHLHLGWHAQDDGSWALGLPVDGGRIRDDGSQRLKTALAVATAELGLEVRLTPSHDLLLLGIDDDRRRRVDELLDAHGVRRAEESTPLRNAAMACPALPTCGLALAEAERVLPTLVHALEDELASLGLGEQPLDFRITGCPNGCARPYVAELALVGRSKDRYVVHVAGGPAGDRLTEELWDGVPTDEVVPRLRPLFRSWAEERRDHERFGDWCHRVGVDALRTLSDAALAVSADTTGGAS